MAKTNACYYIIARYNNADDTADWLLHGHFRVFRLLGPTVVHVLLALPSAG